MQRSNVQVQPLNEQEQRVFEALGPLFEQE